MKRHFADGAEVRKKLKAQRQDISDSFIEGTATWVFGDEKYKSWLSQEQRLAWMSGTAGLGKSFLAHAIVASLEEAFKDHTQTSVAYFYFREEDENLRTFRDALRCAAVQIAEQDTTYCEQVAADISRNGDDEPWKQFFASRFPAKSDAQLYLVLDGIDEASEEDKPLMLGLFHQIAKEELNINVLFTGRAELKSHLSNAVPTTIEVTRERMSEDMQRLIEARCQPKSRVSLSRLQKFRRITRNRIRDRIMRSADGMLYVEHMLRRLNSIGREGAVLKDIEKNMPDTMQGLYELMLAECQRGRTHDQYLALKTLFAMLAYSKRALTLGEAAHLIKLTDPDHSFDIEDEIIGRSARLLDTRRNHDDEEDEVDLQTRTSGESLDEPFDELDDTGRTPVTFQDRSLREYFRAVNVEENGLRTPPSLAHLTVFELIVKVLCFDDQDINGHDDNNLRDYSAHYWAHHFVSIDQGSLTDQEVARVLAGLAKILGNQNNFCATVEADDILYYTDLNEQLGLLGKITEYMVRVKDSGNEFLDGDTRTWVESIQDSTAKSMLRLARGHIENWHNTTPNGTALASWRCAKDALVLVSKGRTSLLSVADDKTGRLRHQE